jgi:hypothetical protein
MDRLEEHIRKNRKDLDSYIPSSGIWKKIRRELKRDERSIGRWLAIAAMVVAILGTAVVLYKPVISRPDTAREMANSDGMMQGNRQLRETEIYYNNLVNSLYREATPLMTGNPEIKRELGSDINQLDSICVQIKKDLKDNVANQEVIEALIQNYRIKIRLLEDMLIILKENDKNPEKIKSNEL